MPLTCLINLVSSIFRQELFDGAKRSRVLPTQGRIPVEHINDSIFDDKVASNRHEVRVKPEVSQDRVLTVVKEAGGTAESIGRFTIYVTDRQAYLDNPKPIGQAYRERMGRHYPAMALVEVKALVDPDAKVEIEATAVI